MNLNAVSIFVKVVELGSYSEASRALDVPKSTVSRAVSGLEEELGVRLLHRTTRQLAVTDAGRAFFDRARSALAGLEDARTAAVARQSEARGTVRITAPVDLATAVLPPLVRAFRARHDGIDLDFVLTGRRVDLVAEAVDLALRAGALDDSSLVARRIGSMAHHFLAAPSYVSARGAPRSVDDLARHDVIGFRPKKGVVEARVRGPGGTKTVSFPVRIGADDFVFAKEAAVAGLGVVLMPWYLGAAELERGALVRVLPEHAAPGAPLHLVYPSARQVPQRVALFRDYLLDVLGKMPWDRS